MDEQQAEVQAAPMTDKSKNRSLKIEKYLIFFVILIVGFVVGVVTRPFLPPQLLGLRQQIVAEEPTFNQLKLPVSISLLSNPIVGQWRGDVKGKLTKVEGNTFTLTDDKGNSITITNKMASGEIFRTLFYDPINVKVKSSTRSAVPIGNIPTDSILEGDFFVFPNAPDVPIGGMFTRIK